MSIPLTTPSLKLNSYSKDSYESCNTSLLNIGTSNHLQNRRLLNPVVRHRLAHLRPKFLRNPVTRARWQDKSKAEVREEVGAEFNAVTVISLVIGTRTVRVPRGTPHHHRRLRRKCKSRPFEAVMLKGLLKPASETGILSRVRWMLLLGVI